MCICSEAVSLRAWAALVRLVVSRAFCESQTQASWVHACTPQLWLRALRARRGRGYVHSLSCCFGVGLHIAWNPHSSRDTELSSMQ